jgi:hypothetical protein
LFKCPLKKQRIVVVVFQMQDVASQIQSSTSAMELHYRISPEVRNQGQPFFLVGTKLDCGNARTQLICHP